ncbi:unnamed protein product [Rotaria sp. Silwood2]|nr:unnamed protein product [Rotaria sp. Silwood2]CAF4505559.1 unnamed protein product [Rotaria sp. Silwood2]
MFRKDSFDSQLAAYEKRLSFQPLPQLEPMTVPLKHYSLCSCCTNNNHKQSNIKRLPSLRYAVDNMITSLVQFLYANNRFMRTQEKSHQSIGDLLSFHTLPYAFKNMVEATTDLAKSARRIKHIDTRTLTRSEREEQQQQIV